MERSWNYDAETNQKPDDVKFLDEGVELEQEQKIQPQQAASKLLHY